MPIRFAKNSVTMDGECTVEEALPLLEYLQTHPRAKISMRACGSVHTAVLQVILASGAALSSPPEDPFLKRWLAGIMGGGSA